MKKILLSLGAVLLTLTACNGSSNGFLDPTTLQTSITTNLNASPKFASDQVQSIQCIPDSTDPTVFQCGITLADNTSGVLTVKVSSDGKSWLVTDAKSG